MSKACVLNLHQNCSRIKTIQIKQRITFLRHIFGTEKKTQKKALKKLMNNALFTQLTLESQNKEAYFRKGKKYKL